MYLDQSSSVVQVASNLSVGNINVGGKYLAAPIRLQCNNQLHRLGIRYHDRPLTCI
jgi:hypothetical protein